MARHTGFANLPLHTGKAPAWLFSRMTRLAREVAVHIVADQGSAELLRRLADPFWFQAFGCVLGFDWHSSGVTTTVTGALKEGLRGLEHELGVFAQGGKGATSRTTPADIVRHCERASIEAAPLVYASRMAAKVDSAAVQDGFELYHHCFFFTPAGEWCVVQQGMNGGARAARRYHWLSESLASFVNEPHQAICSDVRGETLNLVASEHEALRRSCVELAASDPADVIGVVRRHARAAPRLRRRALAATLPFEPEINPTSISAPTLEMPARHEVTLADFDPRRLESVLLSTYERAPATFESLLGLEGVGARTLRALALVSEVIYGTAASTRDPARFAFAHGGKDGTPFPVDRATYDRTVETLQRAMARARVDRSERIDALKRLSRFSRATEPDERPSA
jgi:hypothetical protein